MAIFFLRDLRCELTMLEQKCNGRQLHRPDVPIRPLLNWRRQQNAQYARLVTNDSIYGSFHDLLSIKLLEFINNSNRWISWKDLLQYSVYFHINERLIFQYMCMIHQYNFSKISRKAFIFLTTIWSNPRVKYSWTYGERFLDIGVIRIALRIIVRCYLLVRLISHTREHGMCNTIWSIKYKWEPILHIHIRKTDLIRDISHFSCRKLKIVID